MSLDFSRSRLKPFAHQIEDTQAVLDHPYFFITSEMRTGKSKIVVDAIQFLFEANIIEHALVIAPAPVRDVWYDPDMGEFKKHLWKDFPVRVLEFHARNRAWSQSYTAGAKTRQLECVVTNYEFIRSKNRLAQLLPFCGPRTILICDESSFVKSYDAEQTKAVFQIRRACGRVVLLNGTPISHSPLDLFSQGNLLHPSILDCKYITHYKARYAIQEPVLSHGGNPILSPRGRAIQTITGWTHLDDIQRRFAPYVVRRLQKDCLDLPPKLDPVTLTAVLTPETWRVYKDMRDELVVWFKNGNVATAAQASTKTLRLAQITSGFVGGIEDAAIGEEPLQEGLLESLTLEGDWSNPPIGEPIADDVRKMIEHKPTVGETQEIGREKLDIVLWFLKQRLEQYPNLHIVVWCRFRPELFRMIEEVKKKFPQFEVASICGGQKKAERQRTMQLLHPETTIEGPVFVGGTFGTGSFGLNFTAANHSVNCSFDFSLGKFKQSADRVYGPGMIGPAAYFDIVAVGPNGQKTIDHHIVKTRRMNEDIATWTTDAWIKALTEE